MMNSKKNTENLSEFPTLESFVGNTPLVKLQRLSGNSSNVMGNPIKSLTWLINNLAIAGKVLPKNHYISTGTCTKAIPISKGDKVIADFGKLGIVSFDFKE